MIKISCSIFTLLLIYFNHAFSQTALQTNEELIFSFKTVNGKNIQVIKDKEDAYIFYRASKNGKTELEFPEKNNDSWSKFTFTYYFRPNSGNYSGINVNFLHFYLREYQYVVYDIYYEGDKHDKIGVRCINQQTKKEVDLKAIQRTVKGELADLLHSELITQQIGQLFEE